MKRVPVRLLATLAACAAVAAPAAAAAPEFEVPWTVDGANGQQGQDRDPPPAGANDYGCKPPRNHRHPVVLVHGLGANQAANWGTMSPFLANRGYCVFSLTYGTKPNPVTSPYYTMGGLRRMQLSARELRAFIAKVLRKTGARKVDIVGHSEGSLMPNQYVKFLGGHRFVDDYVGVTPLWDGTNLAGLGTIDQIGQALGVSQGFYDLLEPYCASCHQFVKGSRFLKRMSSRGGPAVRGVDYTMLMTRYDELVMPYTSGVMPGSKVNNIVIQDGCEIDLSEHLSIIYDPRAAYLILNALQPNRPRAVPCVPVLPLIGAPTYSGN